MPMKKIQSCNKMIGKWRYKENDKSHSYNLNIEPGKNGSYLVRYCFVTGENGEKIDCPDEKEIGKCVGENMIVEFNSDFEETPIKCNLKLNDNVLTLSAISKVGSSFFLDKMEFVK